MENFSNYKKYFTIAILLAILVLPTFVLAAWWNPFSWNLWQRIANIFYKQQVVQIQQENQIKNKGQEVSEEQKTKNDKPLIEDVYPLYGDLKWSPITPKKTEGAKPIDGLETKAESMVNGMEAGDKFFDYYEDKLTKLGWEQDGNFAADGMTGSQMGYKKGDNRIVLGYGLKPGKIISSKNEPLQYTCPCRMTYSIFTTANKKVDETADWKTYRNKDYMFEIKYPTSWFYNEFKQTKYKPSGYQENFEGVSFCPEQYDKSNCANLPMMLVQAPIFVNTATSPGNLSSLQLSEESYREIYNKMLLTFKFIK